MITELQQQFAHYLDSPGIGTMLQSMATLTRTCMALVDTDGTVRHLCHEQSGTVCSNGSCGLPDDAAGRMEGSIGHSLPLLHNEELIGELRLSARQPIDQLTELGVAACSRIVEFINHEYEMDNLSSEILSKYEELNVLYDVGESLHINMNREEICRLAVDKVQQVVGADRTGVLLLVDGAQPLSPIADSGYDQGLQNDPSLEAVLLIAGHVAESGKALLVDSPESIPADLEPGLAGAAGADVLWPFLATPINRGDHLLGVLHATDKGDGQIFTANDLKLVQAICSQAATAINNLQMLDALKKTEALKREMDIARSIQMKMLPANPLARGSVLAAGRCTTAANVGGDYYDHICIEDGTDEERDLIHLLIADVSGHDVGAALMMSVGRKVFHTTVRRNFDPSNLMREFNSVMHDDLSASDLFITMFYAQYSHSTRMLRFANAGHNPPFLVRGADGSVETMDADGMIVGVLEDVEFENGEISMQPGDLAIFYTDGVTETENPEAEQYGLERFHRLVQEHRTSSPEDLLDIIYESVKDYSGGTAQYDDITVLILKDNN